MLQNIFYCYILNVFINYILLYVYNLAFVEQVKLFEFYQQFLKSKQMNTQPHSKIAQHFLDITNEICPMTFVKTKLMIEKMSRNDVLEVRLKGKEPLTNVPRSVLEYGHMVLHLEPEHDDQNPLGIHRLLIKKV